MSKLGYILCAGYLLILQAADYTLTTIVLSLPGGYEANPIVRMIGVGNSKIGASVLIVLTAYACYSSNRSRMMTHATIVIGIIYTTLVLWSLILLGTAW